MKNLNYTPFLTKQELNLPFYMATIGNPKLQPNVYRPDGISHHQLLYTVSGGGRCYLNNNFSEVKTGDLFFIPPNNRHEYYPLNNAWETMYITFGGSGFNEFLNHKAGIVFCSDFQKHYNILYNLKNGNCYDELSAYLYKILISYNYLLYEPSSLNIKKRDKISAALKLINENSDCSVSEIAETLNVTTEHFCRIFKEFMGYRPMEYINMLKLQRAKELLNDRDLSIKEVSASAGFNDHSYFGKLFKREFGISPSSYRGH